MKSIVLVLCMSRNVHVDREDSEQNEIYQKRSLLPRQSGGVSTREALPIIVTSTGFLIHTKRLSLAPFYLHSVPNKGQNNNQSKSRGNNLSGGQNNNQSRN